MQDHDSAVCRQLNVSFEMFETGAERRVKGGYCIFRRNRREAAVSYDGEIWRDMHHGWQCLGRYCTPAGSTVASAGQNRQYIDMLYAAWKQMPV